MKQLVVIALSVTALLAQTAMAETTDPRVREKVDTRIDIKKRSRTQVPLQVKQLPFKPTKP